MVDNPIKEDKKNLCTNWDYAQPDYYRFSQDSLDLVKFALDNYSFRKQDQVIDICAGCGVVGMELLLKSKEKF